MFAEGRKSAMLSRVQSPIGRDGHSRFHLQTLGHGGDPLMVLSDCCGFCAVSRAHVEGRWPFAVATCVQLPSQRLHIVLTSPPGFSRSSQRDSSFRVMAQKGSNLLCLSRGMWRQWGEMRVPVAGLRFGCCSLWIHPLPLRHRCWPPCLGLCALTLWLEEALCFPGRL